MNVLSRRATAGFLFPGLAVIAIFMVFPAVWVLYLGLTDESLTGIKSVMPSFVGLGNFGRIFQDRFFYNALKLSFIFVAASGWIGQVALGLFLAVVLHKERSWLKPVLKAAAILAWIIPEVVVAYLWIAFLDRDFGLLNTLLGLVHLGPVNWLYDHALFSIILFNTWRGTAFSMLLFTAAIETIPPSYLETAQVLGASAWRQFKDIILPMIRPVLLTDTILITLWTFNVFTPFLLTQGGPAFSTEILPVYVYRTSFQYFKLGHGAAVSTILLLINLGFAAVYLYAQRRRRA
ncbi:MAG: sugar ABC transporter permease [Elusimicrobia bacterium]|nr:sugar ABC transporter permease [Elusimicrobiota bacterium]